MAGNIFLAILHLLALFHLTDQLRKLTPENGIGTLNSSAEFFVPKQCYGSMGESATGSYRIQFRVIGKGHCQLFLCYPSQLDPNALLNGMAPEIGYYLANNLESNPWMKNCPVEQDENWHGIYVDVDADNISLTMSFYDQSFPINKRNFILDLANSSYSSITTKMHIFNENDGSQQYETIEFEQIRQEFLSIQNKGAHLADFAELWALPLDMLPSDLHQNKIKIFTLSSKENRHPDQHNEDICDVDSGNLVKDNCSVQAWFLQPDDKIIAQNQIAVNTNNNSCLMDMKLPFTDESLLEYPLKMSDTIHITGRLMNDNFIGYFRIHLLHNWKEPDSIMGETILTILVRRNYINFESKYNFTKYEPNIKESIFDKIRQNLEDIDKKFSLNIHADSNGNYTLIINCKNESTFVFTQAIDNPLKYTSTNYIRIEADPGVELQCYQIIRKPSTIVTPAPDPDPSYSLELEYPDGKPTVIIAKMKLPQNATKFDINLVQHNGTQNTGEIVAHFHANLNENFYELGKCRADCQKWTNNKTIYLSDGVNPLTGGKEFLVFRFVQINGSDLVYINNAEMGQMKTNGTPNYIQLKGGLLLLNLTMETIPIFNEYSLENAFKPFNQISFGSSRGLQIYFRCFVEKKCEKSLYIIMKFVITESKLTLLYNNESLSKEIELPENGNLHLNIYANQFEYQIFNGDELILMANYWQFPTPDKFDTIITEGLIFLPEEKPRKEWKQFDLDIALPFSYQLDKPLEIDSSIKIKMEFFNSTDFELTIYLQQDAPMFHKYFGKNVLWLQIKPYELATNLLDFHSGRKNKDLEIEKPFTKLLPGYQSGEFFELEIIVHAYYCKILINGNDLIKDKIMHNLLFEKVDFMQIETKDARDKIIEAEITWPSDNSSKWLTAPGQKQFELIGPLGIPTGESGSLIMRLNRPLRINDAIMFKGKFHNGLNEIRDLYIELLRNTTKNEIFQILKANLEYRSKGNSTIFGLYKDKYDENGKLVRGKNAINSQYFSPTNDEFDVKIRIAGDNKFYVQNGNSNEANITNDGLFWAVQYIQFRFGNYGLETKQNVELDEGYPKIVHEYEKDD